MTRNSFIKSLLLSAVMWTTIGGQAIAQQSPFSHGIAAVVNDDFDTLATDRLTQPH